MSTTRMLDHAMQLRDADRRVSQHREGLRESVGSLDKVLKRAEWEIQTRDNLFDQIEIWKKDGKAVPEELQQAWNTFQQSKYPQEKYRDAIRQILNELVFRYKAAISISNAINRSAKEAIDLATPEARDLATVEGMNPFVQGLSQDATKVSPERAEEMETKRNESAALHNAPSQPNLVGPTF